MKNRTSPKMPFLEAMELNKRAFLLWYKTYPMLFVSSAIGILFSSLTPYVGIYLSAQIINELSLGRNKQILMKLVTITILLTAVLALINAGLSRFKNYQHSLFYYHRAKFYSEKMLDMDFASLDEQKTHDLLSQIEQNERWSGWGIGRLVSNFCDCFDALLRILGAIVLTVSMFTCKIPETAGKLTILNHPMFLFLMIIIILAVPFLSSLCSNQANSYWIKQTDASKMGNRFFSAFGFLAYDRSRTLDMRIYRQGIICDHYQGKCKSFSPDSQIAAYARGPMGGFHVLSAVISTLFIGFIYIFVCLKSFAGAFGIGSVTQYIGSITALSGGVASLMFTIGHMYHNAVFLRNTFEFLDIPNDMYKGSLTIEKRADRNYEVEFIHVSFRYPTSDTDALKNVSLKFKIGERLAVVGQNGSGKTTFIKLLCRLYDPIEGEILLNGINIQKYNYSEYMSLFSVVFQDFKLFAFPLAQNIAVSSDFCKEKVEESLLESGFGERLSTMEEGIETCLYKDFDEKGVEISGGEAQKIALARALYKNSPFIVLDEPTAALDPIAECEVYSKFNEIVDDKTAIYISHRLSSCRFCDSILVFDKGSVVEHGSHEELVAFEGGKYHELWFAQAQYYA